MKIKKPKLRNPVARELVSSSQFKSWVVDNKKKYNRKKLKAQDQKSVGHLYIYVIKVRSDMIHFARGCLRFGINRNNLNSFCKKTPRPSYGE